MSLYSLVRTPLPASGVEHALHARLVDPSEEQLVTAGANQIQSVSFSLSDESAFRDEALARAVDDAEARAAILAQAAGLELGSPISIDTLGSGVIPAGDVEFSTATAVPIEIGPYSVNARVVVVYATSLNTDR